MESAVKMEEQTLKLMIIDDEIHLLKLLEKHFEVNFEVRVYEEAQEALRDLSDFNPDAVICDWNLPVVTGREFLDKVRSLRSYEYVPIIVLTAYDGRSTEANSFLAGADEFMSKPVRLEQLEKRVRELIFTQKFSRSLKKKLIKRNDERRIKKIEDEKAKVEEEVLEDICEDSVEESELSETEKLARALDDLSDLGESQYGDKPEDS